MLDERDMRFPMGTSLLEYSTELFEILAHFQEPYREAMCTDSHGGIKKALQFKMENSVKKFNETRKKEIEMNNVFLPLKLSNHNCQCFYLKGVNFRKAILDGSDFSNANLDGANLTMASAKEAKFIKASIKQTDFSEGHFEGSTFTEVQGEGAIFNDANCNRTHFNRAFLSGSFFVQAIVNNAIFWKANLRDVNFSSAHCNNSDFSDSLGEKSKFWKSHCKDANFGQSKFDEVDFSDAHCEGSSFWMASLKGADFSDSHCTEADFSGADCGETDFTNAVLRNAKMDKKTNLYQCWFYGAEIEGSKLKFAIKSFFKSDKTLLPFPEERDAAEATTEEEAKEKLEESRTIYLDFKNYLTVQGMYSQSSEFFIREREMNRAMIKYRIQPWKGCEFGDELDENGNTKPQLDPATGLALPAWKVTWICLLHFLDWLKENIEDGTAFIFYSILYHFGRYGEKPHYILLWSSVMIAIFGILYGLGKGVDGVGDDGWLNASRNYLYFSIVTFTTLGYGDLKPLGWWRIVAGLEAVFGAFSLSYFVVSWMRKVTR
jgi:hypothetical protein